MRPTLRLALLLVASTAIFSHYNQAHASLDRLVRQSNGENEKEVASNAKEQPATTNNNQQQQTGRLYPDIPKQPNFVPQFNGIGPQTYPAIGHPHGQTPFVPFGMQIPVSRLNADQQPVPFGRVLPQPRAMTPAERLQSQSFANGLGRRLLSMIGIENNNNSTTNNSEGENNDNNMQQQQQRKSSMDDMVKQLHNSTVLQQLNRGVNTIYGGLSKMYNSTVQEQLNLLQERFKSELNQTNNPSNAWQQRMAEQVPQFFKQIAMKVGNAQEQLNKVWQDVSQATQNNSTILTNRQQQQPQQRSFFNSFDQFFTNNNMNGGGGGDFFNNVGQSLGFNNNRQQPIMMAQQQQQQQQPQSQPRQQQPDLSVQLMEFWHSQVQPQIGMIGQQVGRVWRDLTASGALLPETIIRSRTNQATRGQNNNSTANNNNNNLVDEILKEVDMNNSEYTLIDAKNEEATAGVENDDKQPQQQPGIKLSPQMQNRLIAMQRELNQLWMGLTNSLQGAINNVKNSVNPQVARNAQFGPPPPQAGTMMGASDNSPDPQINEIDGKVKDLSKLQRDADMVYETVQQQQRETQQRQTFGDRFKNFFNNMNVDMSGVNQLPDRLGQSFNRFGNVVGDLWNQIPERWDNFMQNRRPQQQQQQQADVMRAMMKSSTTTTTTSTTTEDPKPER